MIMKILFNLIVLVLAYETRASITYEYNEESQKKHSYSSIKDIPSEIILITFDFLHGKDFLNLSNTCRKFYTLSQHQILLIPKENDQYLQIINNNPSRALDLMPRTPLKTLHIRNRNLADHMLPTLPEDNINFLESWRNYVLLVLLSKYLGNSKLYDCMQGKVEVARERFENFDIVFSNLQSELQILRRNALWEQLAYANNTDRNTLIDAYSNGEDPYIDQNINKATQWKEYGNMIDELEKKIDKMKI